MDVARTDEDGEGGAVGGPGETGDAREGGVGVGAGEGALEGAEEALEVVLVAEGADDATGRDRELGAARGGGEEWAGGVVVRADGARRSRADRGREEAARGERRAAGETKRAAG